MKMKTWHIDKFTFMRSENTDGNIIRSLATTKDTNAIRDATNTLYGS